MKHLEQQVVFKDLAHDHYSLVKKLIKSGDVSKSDQRFINEVNNRDYVSSSNLFCNDTCVELKLQSVDLKKTCLSNCLLAYSASYKMSEFNKLKVESSIKAHERTGSNFFAH